MIIKGYNNIVNASATTEVNRLKHFALVKKMTSANFQKTIQPVLWLCHSTNKQDGIGGFMP